MKRNLYYLFSLFFISSCLFSQITVLEDNFTNTSFGRSWKPGSNNWKTGNGNVEINTKLYDELLASDLFINDNAGYAIELEFKGSRAGLYFGLDERGSKNLSHMIRFDDNCMLAGYFNANGVYIATSTFDVKYPLNEWIKMRVDIDPYYKTYTIFIQNKLIGKDKNLKFSSGYFGLQASEGLSLFKSVKVIIKTKKITKPKQKPGDFVKFSHVKYVKCSGDGFMIFNPVGNYIQKIDNDGKMIHQKIWDDEKINENAFFENKKFSVQRKKILIFDYNSKLIDSISERLVLPAAILIDKKGYIFVSDPGQNAILKYDRNKKLMSIFYAGSINGFVAPKGMDFYGENELVIADYDRLVFVDKSLNEIDPVIKLDNGKANVSWKSKGKNKPYIELTPDGGNRKIFPAVAKGEQLSLDVDNLSSLTKYSIKIFPSLKVIPVNDKRSKEFRFTTGSNKQGIMIYSRLPVLYMVYKTISYRDKYPKDKYPNIPDGKTLTDDEMEYLKTATAFNSQFYFRNSGCKVYLDFDFYVVEDTLWLNEVGDQDPYWLPPNARVTKDYEIAVKKLGKSPQDYAGLICPYAWQNYPARRTSAMADPGRKDTIRIRQAYGGAAMGIPAPWKYGKTAGYTGNPFQDKYSRQDWLITHEFHHQIDALMEVSGFPEYYHADMPWKMQGRFGEDFDFSANIIRLAKPEWWLSLKFGQVMETNDLDNDGVPDDDPTLPFDEKRLGGNPNSKDTDNDGLDDLSEIMAGTSMGTNINNIDTDSDGIPDGKDKYPLYSIDPIINKNLDSEGINWQRFGSIKTKNINAGLKISWDNDYIYAGYDADKPANFMLQIDANNDGWFHGFDNIQTRIFYNGDSSKVEEYYLRDCSSWSDVPMDKKDILKIQDCKVYTTPDTLKKKYSLYVKIPKNPDYGLDLKKEKKISVRIGLQTTPDRWVWEELFERNYMMEITLWE